MLALGSCFMQVPPGGTGKDWSQSGLGNGQLQGGAGQRTPLATGLHFAYTLTLVGLCLPGGNGVPSGSPYLGHGGLGRGGGGGEAGLTFFFSVLRDSKGG